MHWHPEPGADGFWAVTRYRDVKAVGRDPVTFSSTPTILISDEIALDEDHVMMLTADPPRHTAMRRLVASRFIPKAAKAMRPRIEELATRIIDGVVDRGACDLVTDIAGLMPSYVIADMLGIPHEDGVALYALTETIHAAPDSQAAGAGMAAVGRDVQLRPRRMGGPSGRSRPTTWRPSSPMGPSTATSSTSSTSTCSSCC